MNVLEDLFHESIYFYDGYIYESLFIYIYLSITISYYNFHNIWLKACI